MQSLRDKYTGLVCILPQHLLGRFISRTIVVSFGGESQAMGTCDGNYCRSLIKNTIIIFNFIYLYGEIKLIIIYVEFGVGNFVGKFIFELRIPCRLLMGVDHPLSCRYHSCFDRICIALIPKIFCWRNSSSVHIHYLLKSH